MTSYRRRANEVLKRAIGWDFAVWSAVDSPTMLFTNCILFDGQPDILRLEAKFFELEFAGDDINLFVDIGLAKRSACSLYAATEGKPSRSRRFRDRMLQMGCGDELRAEFNGIF